MRNLLISILLKLIGDEADALDEKKLKDWLWMSYEDGGFSQYYTIRKRALQNHLLLGQDQKETWVAVGQYRELKALRANIIKESQARIKRQKKAEEQREEQAGK